MRSCLGVSVSDDAIRGVLVRAGRVTWHGVAEVVGEARADERIATALDRLLSDVPRRRLGRFRVRVALGLTHSQVKRIDGLPSVRQAKLVNRVLKENPDAFFLRVGGRTLVTDVERRADGSAWAAALDGTLVDVVLDVLRRRHLLLDAILPFVAAVARVVPAGTWQFSDGGRDVVLTTIEGALVQACRGGRSEPPAIGALGALDAIGPDAPRFAAAYGSAIGPSRAPFSWIPERNPSRVRLFDTIAVAVASALFVATIGAAVAARGVHATRVTTAAFAELTAFRDAEIEAARVGADLRRTTTDLDRIRQFEMTRGRVTMLLGALSETLPDSTALTSLRVDTLEASFVALAPRAAEVLPALVGVPGAIGQRIVGSVTREIQSGARLERASFRFRRTPTLGK